MALKPTDTVLNDLPSTGNSELDTLLNNMAEIGLAGLEMHNWEGYGSAPVLPQKGWERVARKVMTVETAVLIVHLCHIHAMHRVFVVSALDQYRARIESLKTWAEQKAVGKALIKLAPEALLKGFTVALSWITRLVTESDAIEQARQIQLKIRRQGLAGRYDAAEHYLRFGEKQRPRVTKTVSTRK